MIRLAVRVRRDQAELVLAELLDLAPGGVEEVDVSEEVVEYAVYGPPGELPALPDVRAAAGGALVQVGSTEVPDDWAERWRSFHRPLVLGDRLVVRPPWEQAAAGVALDLVIDPGRAFGTGAHATTRLCLEMLLDLEPPVVRMTTGISRAQAPVIDLGCGSGVLAIAAARLGWGAVLGLDFDPLAVQATVENARVNGVASLVSAERFDLRSAPVPAASLVLANLLAPLLLEWCSQLAGGMAEPPGCVIASGLLEREADPIAQAFAGVGLAETGRRVHGEWAALLLARSDQG
ncbi:MAG TPA: 50S ribosomal protein L11 methyltransferase [Solirubrobacteraceae bacterium]|nr:50S ribosomal protein L11 methyltransferase [Solirubrobacteraceae bacterium]